MVLILAVTATLLSTTPMVHAEQDPVVTTSHGHSGRDKVRMSNLLATLFEMKNAETRNMKRMGAGFQPSPQLENPSVSFHLTEGSPSSNFLLVEERPLHFSEEKLPTPLNRFQNPAEMASAGDVRSTQGLDSVVGEKTRGFLASGGSHLQREGSEMGMRHQYIRDLKREFAQRDMGNSE